MLTSYISNQMVGMTKEMYFNMCADLGSEPIESEIPVEYHELPTEVQEAVGVYYKLRDEWEGMSGSYMGKSYAGLKDILDILEISKESRKDILELIQIIDSIRSKIIKDTQEAQRSTKDQQQASPP